MAPSRPARVRKQAGFTLLELMVIVTIIMIVMALAAPGLMRGFAISRAQRSVYDLARVARRGRSESMGYGRAYMMRFRTGASAAGAWERFELFRGVTDSCSANDWSAITANSCAAGDLDCVDVFSSEMWRTPAHWVTVTSPVTFVCWEPDGEMLVSTDGLGTARPNFTRNRAGIVVDIQRFDGGAGAVEIRRVVLPFATAPRVQR